MHIVEGINGKYCYARECIWDSKKRSYVTPGKCIGQIIVAEDNNKIFKPNKFLALLLNQFVYDPSDLSSHEKLIVNIAIEKYGKDIIKSADATANSNTQFQTAHAIFDGFHLVFGSITKRYKLQLFLEEAFPKQTALDILSLSWYIASEGSALSNSDSWLEYYENPRGAPISSQDISRLLDRITTDGMMSFYKFWLASNANGKDEDRTLYDLTSISFNGNSIHAADWGYKRDVDKSCQVNFALMCKRKTGMPLFAWSMNGSISDVTTLEDTLGFIDKLGYKPNCLMMDRGFASKDNISYMLRRNYTFLQALRINAEWIHHLIDAGEDERTSPDSMIKDDERTYYSSKVKCQWTIFKHLSGRKAGREEISVNIFKSKEQNKDLAFGDDVKVIAQNTCNFYALFCQDLVGGQRDRFMESLKEERDRLIEDDYSTVKKELAKYFIINMPKFARHRSVSYNLDNIKHFDTKYSGYVCFLSNDKSIKNAEDALSEYSTRDYIEKDFDEMKNDLDMRRLRVHSDQRMKARLFIQFIAEIYMREIRIRLRDSEECKRMTKRQIFSHLKTIYKIKFKGKYRDIRPSLSKSQRSILQALDIDAIR